MKFHEYKTLWEEVRRTLPRDVTEEKFYAVAMAGGARTGNGLILAEGIWKQLRRPYYQVWPAIVPALPMAEQNAAIRPFPIPCFCSASASSTTVFPVT